MLHSSEFSNCEERVSVGSELNKGYVENFSADKTVTVNSLAKFYIDLKIIPYSFFS